MPTKGIICFTATFAISIKNLVQESFLARVEDEQNRFLDSSAQITATFKAIHFGYAVQSDDGVSFRLPMNMKLIELIPPLIEFWAMELQSILRAH